MDEGKPKGVFFIWGHQAILAGLLATIIINILGDPFNIPGILEYTSYAKISLPLNPSHLASIGEEYGMGRTSKQNRYLSTLALGRSQTSIIV